MDSTLSTTGTMTEPLEEFGGERALRSGRRGRWFESSRPDFPDLLAAVNGLLPGETLLVEGLPNEVYHSLPVPSKSTLWDFRHRGPVWYAARHVFETATPFSSAATSLGTLVHAALELGFEVYERDVVVVPTKFVTASGSLSCSREAKEWREQQGPGAILATSGELFVVNRMIEQFQQNSLARELYERVTHREVSCFGRLHTGHLLRCRFDAITEDGWLLDWKTTREKHPLKTFHAACIEHGYAYASALYSMLAAMSGVSERRLTFVAMSTTAEYEVQVVEIPEVLVQRCEQQIIDDLFEIDDRHETGNWLPTGYGELHTLRFPEWAMRTE